MQVVSEPAASVRLKRGTETDGATTEEKKQTASQSFINAAADPGFHVVAAAQLLGPKLWVPLHAPEFLVGYTPNSPSDWLQTPTLSPFRNGRIDLRKRSPDIARRAEAATLTSMGQLSRAEAAKSRL